MLLGSSRWSCRVTEEGNIYRRGRVLARRGALQAKCPDVIPPRDSTHCQSKKSEKVHTLSVQKVRKSPTLAWNSRIQIKFLTWVKKLIFKLLIYLCKAFYKRKHVGILIKQMLVMEKIYSLSKSQWRISQLPSLHGSRLGIRNTTWPSPILPPYKAQSCCFLPSKVMSSEFTS